MSIFSLPPAGITRGSHRSDKNPALRGKLFRDEAPSKGGEEQACRYNPSASSADSVSPPLTPELASMGPVLTLAPLQRKDERGDAYGGANARTSSPLRGGLER